MGNITVKRGRAKNTVLRNFYKRSIKEFSIQETKMIPAHEKK